MVIIVDTFASSPSFAINDDRGSMPQRSHDAPMASVPSKCRCFPPLTGEEEPFRWHDETCCSPRISRSAARRATNTCDVRENRNAERFSERYGVQMYAPTAYLMESYNTPTCDAGHQLLADWTLKLAGWERTPRIARDASCRLRHSVGFKIWPPWTMRDRPPRSHPDSQ